MAVSASTASSEGGLLPGHVGTSLQQVSRSAKSLTPMAYLSSPSTPHSDRSLTINSRPLPTNQKGDFPVSLSAAYGEPEQSSPGAYPHRPVIVIDPPRVGKIEWTGTEREPNVLTRKGPVALQTFVRSGNFFLLCPPLRPHPGVPLDANGAFDFRAFLLSQGTGGVQPLHKQADGNGWAPPIYEP
uniref:Uncharacterized protein n=1 Tax=Neospora caninum (strain Liverpool) TaxID=572307 RepID=A0A0F7ULY5_NEOCL|nr:TPA: hypothetical protein BN1204_066095 [Neospora caninum Liverpool]